MAKRYGAGKMGSKNSSPMISEGSGMAFLPTEVIVKAYPKMSGYDKGIPADSMSGMDAQVSATMGSIKGQTKPRKS